MSALAVGVFFLLLLVWHAALWAMACVFIAYASGWIRLARSHPRPQHADHGKSASGMLMIGERWAGSVVVHADPDGLAIAPAPLLRIAHPAFVLPWDGFHACGSIESPVTRATHVHFGETALSFYGNAAEFVGTTLGAHGVTA